MRTSTHLQRDEDKPVVTFAWWNAPLLFSLHLPLVIGLTYVTGLRLLGGILLSLILNVFLPLAD